MKFRRNNIILLSLLFIGINKFSYAQPGWAYMLKGNLNEIDSIALKFCLNNSICYLGTIEVDSTTELSRVVHLSVLHSLVINIALRTLPAELKFFELPILNQLCIYGDSLQDLTNLPQLPSLRTLHIGGYSGDILKIGMEQSPSLCELSISSQNVQDFGNILSNKNLISLTIYGCPKLKHLPKYEHGDLNHISKLCISGSALELNEIKNLNGLKTLIIIGGEFETIPDFFPKSIEYLSISHNAALNNIDNLKKYPNLKRINISNNDQIADYRINCCD
jgi:hypothetical protein